MYKLKVRVGKNGHEAWTNASEPTNTASVKVETNDVTTPIASQHIESKTEDAPKTARSLLTLPLPLKTKGDSQIDFHQVSLPLPAFIAQKYTSDSQSTKTSSDSTATTARGSKNKNKNSKNVNEKQNENTVTTTSSTDTVQDENNKINDKTQPKKSKKPKTPKSAAILHKLDNDDSITVTIGDLRELLQKNNARLVHELSRNVLMVAASLTTHRQRKAAEEQWIEDYSTTESQFISHSLHTSLALKSILAKTNSTTSAISPISSKSSSTQSPVTQIHSDDSSS
jgi:hypothetical protein